MNLYHLRYFSTLAHIEHYTKAADILAITQPSLSYAISTLEEELGVKLFNLYCDKVLTSDILNGLKEKKYDLGFCSKLDNEPLIEFIPVARQELVVIVPLDHPLAVKDEVRLEDTIPYKQIIFKV